jgi:sec-independent protein translocase protein TatB
MFDVGISEIMVIAVVALIVLGPEKLPKTARTLGHLFGRLQRYVSDVKADINRELALEELKKMQAEVTTAATEFKASVSSAAEDVQSKVNAVEADLNSAANEMKAETPIEIASPAEPEAQAQLPLSGPAASEPPRQASLPGFDRG